MKITSEIINPRFGRRVVRFRAVISKSKKLNIEKRRQKTWRFKAAAPKVTAEELLVSVEAEAKRWEKKVLAKLI